MHKVVGIRYEGGGDFVDVEIRSFMSRVYYDKCIEWLDEEQRIWKF